MASFLGGRPALGDPFGIGVAAFRARIAIVHGRTVAVRCTFGGMTRAANEDALFCDGGSLNCHNVLEIPRLPLRAARAWANKEKGWTVTDGNDYCLECSTDSGQQWRVIRRGDNPGGTKPSPFAQPDE